MLLEDDYDILQLLNIRKQGEGEGETNSEMGRRDKFTATRKNESYGISLIFDVEKLEKFDDRYSDSYLKGDNVKIEVKLKIEEDEETGYSGDSGDFGDFLGVRSNNILEKNLQEEEQIQDNNNNNNNNILPSFDANVESNSDSNSNNNKTHTHSRSLKSLKSL